MKILDIQLKHSTKVTTIITTETLVRHQAPNSHTKKSLHHKLHIHIIYLNVDLAKVTY